MKVGFHQKAAVFNKEGKFLAIKRSYGAQTWDIPGGAVEIPEVHEDALRREIREEAGIEVDQIAPLQVKSAYNKEADEYVLFIGYLCFARSSEVHISTEHTEYRWVSKDEFLQMEATPYVKDFVRDTL